MRYMFIDTDTASDDAVAIVMALKNKDTKVVGITAVSGNVPVDLACKNALISAEMAGTYVPPVYRGADRPLVRDITYSYDTHGTDGMGEMNLPDPKTPLTPGNGVLKMIEEIYRYKGQLEIVALGPLTDIALAVRLDPGIVPLIKRLVIMGTTGFGPGNVTPVAEFNIWADPEACDIVLKSGINQCYVGWDMCTGDAVITKEEIDDIMQNGTDCAKFCIRCNQTLMNLNARRFGAPCLDMADPVAMAVALWPDQVEKDTVYAYTFVECQKGECYGMVVSDYTNNAGKPANAHMCRSIHIDAMKKLLLEHIQ